jgi:Fur family transcriptional regulator, ferric uptake regulator
VERRALLKELSSTGIRLTRQRRLLVETLQEAREHIDAASLLKLARRRDPLINRATVYRTLDLLKSLRLIDELDLMHLEGEKHFYEARTSLDHLHLACFKCGGISEYRSPTFKQLKDEIARENEFEVGVIRLEVGGLCKKCRQSSGVG